MGRVEVTYKTIGIRTASNFSTAKLEGRKKNVFKFLRNIDFEFYSQQNICQILIKSKVILDM